MKKLLIVVGVIIVVVLLALLVIPMFINPNDYKEEIVEQVKKHTGRDLTITGDLKMSKFPSLGVDIGEIALSNAPGFGDQPMLKSGQASVSVKLLPLLKKDIQVSTLKLKDVFIYLARDKSGKANWDDLVAPDNVKETEKTGEEKESDSNEPSAAVAIGGIDLENANLIWDDQSQGKKYTISNLNLKTGELALNQPIDLELFCNIDATVEGIAGQLALKGLIEYDLDGKKYSVHLLDFSTDLTGTGVPGGAVNLKLKASAVEADLTAGTVSVAGLDLNAMGTKIEGDIDATHIFDKMPLANGTLKIDAQSIPELLKALGQNPEQIPLQKLTADAAFKSGKDSMSFERLIANATLHGGLFKEPENVKLEIKGGVNITEQTLTLTALLFQGLEASIQGKLKVSHLSDKIPLVDGNLRITANDVAKLLIAAGQDPAKIPVKKIKVDTKLTSTAESMNIETLLATATIHGGQFKDPLDVKLNVKGDINIGKETAHFTQLSFQGLGASVNGNIRASKILSPIPLLNGQLNINATDVPALMAALGQDASLPLKRLVAQTKLTSTADSMTVENLSAKATLAGDQIPNSPVDVTLNTTAEVNLTQETLNVRNFVINGMGLNVQGAVTGTQIIKNPNLKGNLKIAPFNLRQLMTQMKLDMPVTADTKVLSNLSFDSQFKATKDSLSLKGMSIKLDDSRIHGDLAVVNFSNPAPTFNINIDAINVDRYLPPETKEQKSTAPTVSKPTTDTAEDSPMEVLRALTAQGTLNIGRLTVSNTKLQNIKLGLNAKAGRIQLSPAQANLYQGSYSGTVSLDAMGNQPVINFTSGLKNVQVAPLLTDLTGDAKIAGTLVGNLKISAVGAEADAIKASLNGSTDLKFTDGAILGINIAKIIREAEAKLSGKTLAADSNEPVKTDFSELSVSTVIKNGLISNQDFLMKSPYLRVTGDGTANLISEAVDYRVTATVVRSGKGQGGEDLTDLKGIAIPIKVSGTFSDMKYRPDLAGLLAARANKELEKHKEELRKKAAEKLDKIIPNELKGLGGLLGGGLLGGNTNKSEDGAMPPAEQQGQPVDMIPPPAQQQRPEDALKDTLKGIFKF